MAHTEALSESDCRHVDEWRHQTMVLDLDLTYDNFVTEAQARHVDDYRAAVDAH